MIRTQRLLAAVQWRPSLPSKPHSMRIPTTSLASAILLMLLSSHSLAHEVRIANYSEIGVIAAGKPDDTFILQNGTWRDATIRITAGGTKGHPILIKAETPGQVILSGSSSLEIRAPYVIVDGLSFKEGSVAKGAVIQFESDYGTVRNTAIVDYNPPDWHTPYNWVLFSGSHNLLTRCFFRGKANMHALVENSESNARYNSTTKCYFKDIPFRARVNGREIVKILGAGHVDASSPDGAYFTLEDNLFEHADGEGVEVVSLKANYNQVIHNTVIASIGSINIRRGSYEEIKGNVILGQGVAGAEGIRMSGSHNLIQSNFISGCGYGIAVSSGEYWDKPLTPAYVVNDRDGRTPNKSRYPQNKYVTISQNVTVGNSGPDLDIGVEEYKKHWPENQNVLIPEECVIENNRFYRPNGGISVIGKIPESNPPLDRLTFKPNTYADNTILGGKNTFAPASVGFKETPIPPGWSEGQVTAGFKPLTAAEVGPEWLKDGSVHE